MTAIICHQFVSNPIAKIWLEERLSTSVVRFEINNKLLHHQMSKKAAPILEQTGSIHKAKLSHAILVFMIFMILVCLFLACYSS